MSKRYPGGIIRKTPQTPSQTSAQGIWDMASVTQAAKENTWPIAGVPDPISKSLRFRSSASAYLNRTPSSTSNRQIFTWSSWIKLGLIPFSANGYIFSSRQAAADNFGINITTGSAIQIDGAVSSTSLQLTTTAVYRDPSSWYHVVLTVDTTQTTSSNRIKLYVNGVQVTAFSTATYPAQNSNLAVNLNTAPHTIGGYNGANNLYDGYLTEVYFIDGQALTPSSFGNTNDQTGVWQPIAYTGTYGTNGFYLPFSNIASTATLGNDFSGNNNNWTTNNISLTSGVTYDSMVDVPTQWIPYNTAGDTGALFRGNYCVLNPIFNVNGTIVTYSDGNLAFSHSSSSGNATKMTVQGTIALPAGKFYWEYTVGATVNDQVGIGTMLVVGGSADGTAGARYINNGTFQSSYTTPSSAASYTTGDVIGMAYDQPNGTLAFYKNNSLQGTVTNISTSEVFFPLRSPNTSGSGGAGVFNFGQRPFSYTPPSGFVTLNTRNLPTPTIGATATTQAGKYMNTVLWTGNGNSTRSLTSVGFQPDFSWLKSRSEARNHTLYDAVRGAGSNKALSSSTTDPEGLGTTAGASASFGYVSTFDTDGFSVSTGSTNAAYVNVNNETYVAWNWRASNATAVTNTAGTITSTVSANTTAGFSVVTYTGTGANATVGHGLGVAPSMIIVKARNVGTQDWQVYHVTLGINQAIQLNLTSAASPATNYWFNGVTSTVFGVNGSYPGVNGNGNTYVAYCFAQVAGYSAFGSYTGNGSSDGPFVYLGFRPRFVMFKRTDTADFWTIYDTSRSPSNIENLALYPNSSNAEATETNNPIDGLSNGFKARGAGTTSNASGATYIYMAFAENPFKYSLAR